MKRWKKHGRTMDGGNLEIANPTIPRFPPPRLLLIPPSKTHPSKKCYPCARSNVLPMSQSAHAQEIRH